MMYSQTQFNYSYPQYQPSSQPVQMNMMPPNPMAQPANFYPMNQSQPNMMWPQSQQQQQSSYYPQQQYQQYQPQYQQHQQPSMMVYQQPPASYQYSQYPQFQPQMQYQNQQVFPYNNNNYDQKVVPFETINHEKFHPVQPLMQQGPFMDNKLPFYPLHHEKFMPILEIAPAIPAEKLSGQINLSTKSLQQDQQPKQQTQPAPRKKSKKSYSDRIYTVTRNIPKNFIKGIFNYIRLSQDRVTSMLGSDRLFQKLIFRFKQKQDSIFSISDLKQFLLNQSDSPDLELVHKVIRIFAYKFSREQLNTYVQNHKKLKIGNLLIRYRKILELGLRDPTYFDKWSQV